MFGRPSRTAIVVALVVLMAVPVGLIGTARASDPFLAEIIMFGGNFAPRGWALCDGQLLAISSNSALFSLLGTTYGGDGRTTFGLPEMRGRVPVHAGTGPGLSQRRLGEKSGSQSTTLTVANLPSHTHTATAVMRATTARGNNSNPTGRALANDARETQYSNTAPSVDMAAGAVTVTVGSTGSGTSFTNMQPYTVVNFIIALQGTYPSRN